jgi:hypothetical protein
MSKFSKSDEENEFLRSKTHYVFFGHSLVLSCFRVMLIAYYSTMIFFLFFNQMPQLPNYENMKTLNND